jgi:hypothetical protein
MLQILLELIKMPMTVYRGTVAYIAVRGDFETLKSRFIGFMRRALPTLQCSGKVKWYQIN